VCVPPAMAPDTVGMSFTELTLIDTLLFVVSVPSLTAIAMDVSPLKFATGV